MKIVGMNQIRFNNYRVFYCRVHHYYRKMGYDTKELNVEDFWDGFPLDVGGEYIDYRSFLRMERGDFFRRENESH